jgi:tetratricopeptide (TPR) repeat protein
MQDAQAALEPTVDRAGEGALERALTLHRIGETAQARALYVQILDQAPEQPNALHLFGLLNFQDGRIDDALVCWEALVRVCPTAPQAWHLLADARRAAGDRAGEADAYRHAVELEPDNVAVWHALGAAELAGSRIEAAIAAYDRVIALKPDFAEAYAGLGAALCSAGRIAEGRSAAEMAAWLDPKLGQAWFVLGSALKSEGRLQDAATALERSVDLEPEFAAKRLNLANVYGALNREADAERELRAALAIDPDLKEAMSNLAFLLIGADRVLEAAEICERALALDPVHDEARWALTLSLLRQGDYARGWPLYALCEWNGPAKARFAEKFTTPMWRGELIEGRTLLIYASEGLGDTIQFSRYLKLLADRGVRAILACDAKLVGLLQQVPGAAAVVDRLGELPAHDLWIEQMSLPWLMGTTLETIPPALGDIAADPARVVAWRARLPRGRRVGIVWAGNPNHPNDARRSMPTIALEPILAVPGWSAVSLQVGALSGEITELFGLRDHSAELTDFAETAALVANLDLVIAVDTATAHLAATMGKPVWVLLSATAEWRWLAGRRDTPWYPTMRTFRQARLGDWQEVVDEVAQALSRTVEMPQTA